MTLVHALHSVEAVWQVGPGAVSVSVVATVRMTSSFSADARSVMTGHSEFSVTVCRAVNFPSSEQLHGLAFEREGRRVIGDCEFKEDHLPWSH